MSPHPPRNTRDVEMPFPEPAPTVPARVIGALAPVVAMMHMRLTRPLPCRAPVHDVLPGRNGDDGGEDGWGEGGAGSEVGGGCRGGLRFRSGHGVPGACRDWECAGEREGEEEECCGMHRG